MAATVWRGFLSFGLVSFPIRLFAAARADHISFHMLHKKDLSRVKEVWYCAEENRPIDRSEIVKGYEESKGHYVVVGDDDLKKIAPATASTLDVVQFVKSGEVDPIYFESSYYLSPDESVTKPFELFSQALSTSEQQAIGKVTMHGREHVVLIRTGDGGLILHTLYYPNELHRANQHNLKAGKTTAKELELARTLIRQMSGPFHPDEFHDTYRENVERLIEEKKRGKRITAVPSRRKAPVIDLMEALKRSLKAAPVDASKSKSRSASSKGGRRSKAA